MRHSRWAASSITFGPVGRLVATALMFLPLWWSVYYAGPFGIVGLVVWGGVWLPKALRDIWRSVPTEPLDPLDVGNLVTPSNELDPETAITERVGPSRW
jgi:hypothetical protein